MPFWLIQLLILLFPFVAGYFAFKKWVEYKNVEHISKIEWVMLEVSLPKDVYKSPVAMELFLMSLIKGDVDKPYDLYWKGLVSTWFSLEIASIEGNIYFFVRTIKKFKDLIESQIYAQFPKAEIHEVDDYTKYVPRFDPEKKDWSVWGCEYVLKKDDAYPIKTYVDYGLDKAAGSLEEEEKVDPLSTVLEFFGSLKQGEQMWFQILVRPVPKAKDWRKDAEKEITKIMKRDVKPEKDKIIFPPVLNPAEKEATEALARSMSKQAFECGIRTMYIYREDAIRTGYIFGVLNLLRPFNSETLNSFKSTNSTGSEYPYEDYKQIRKKAQKEEMFKAFIARSYFNWPHHDAKWLVNKERKPIILTTEELATIYRFPGKVAETPSLERIEAVKAEPPINLPI